MEQRQSTQTEGNCPKPHTERVAMNKNWRLVFKIPENKKGLLGIKNDSRTFFKSKDRKIKFEENSMHTGDLTPT